MIITGQYVVTRPGEIIADGAICVEGERIAAVGKRDDVLKQFPSKPVLERHGCLVTPALVNAHCHLELEFCKNKVEYRGNFVEWLQEVRNLKHDMMVMPGYFPERSVKAVLSSGTTTLCDHYTMQMDFEDIRLAGLRYYGFRELFEFNNHNPNMKRLRDATICSYAVHSPYTTSAEIAQAALAIAREKGVPISMHLSEMQQELEFIRSSNSDIEQLLRRAGAWDDEWRGTGMTSVQYFDSLGLLAPDVFCVHLNYITTEDIEILAARDITHVYCPRSHAFFMHPDHPLAKMRDAGIRSCLGTDSYGSNVNLNILEEAKLAWVEFPRLTAEEILAMMTENPLRPLKLDGELGKLEKGFLADIAIWEGCEGESFDDMMRWLVRQKAANLVMCSGRVVYED